jgi:transposase-like protein
MSKSKDLRLPVHLDHKTKKFKLNELISSDKKSTQYFSNLRGNGKRLCPRCMCEVQYNLKSNRHWCKDCRYNFGEFTGTYLARIKIKPSVIIHLLDRFVCKRMRINPTFDIGN